MIRKQKVVVKDNMGLPNYMTAFIWEGSQDPAEVPAMFKVRGKVMKAVLVSQFHNTEINGVPCSLPYREPWTRISMDAAAAACREKGEGWHLLTNTEYTFLLDESRKLGTEPHGNTDDGRDYDHPEERGVLSDGYHTLTGLDPVTWSHDHTDGGVYGLKGNVWEMVQGLRLHRGTVEYIKDNDAAAAETDTGKHSPEWTTATTEDGKPVKLSAEDSGVVITTGTVRKAWDYCHMKDVRLKGLDQVPPVLLTLGVLPPDWEGRQDGIYVDSEEDEVVPFRGSSFHYTSSGGPSALNLGNPRSHDGHDVGFRSALYLENWEPQTE